MSLFNYCRRLSCGLALWCAVAASASAATKAEPEARNYTIEGNLMPTRMANVQIQGVSKRYSASTVAYWDGKFKFKKLAAGTYNLSVVVYRFGEFRQTVSVGPSSADDKGRVFVTVTLNPARASRIFTPKDRHTVSATRLFIPEKAWKEFFEAQKQLKKDDNEGALEHLRKAIELAPNFGHAYNTMGTIAYSNKQFDVAEQHFREAMKRDKDIYEPIVNLGGVLLNLGQLEEAVKMNQEALMRRPKDALANAQLGFTYQALKKPDLAIKYLEEAKKLDPGHFSNPQLMLSEIYIRRGQPKAAAAELEHFLRYHPDFPDAAKLKDYIRKLRSGASGAP